jgi:glycosyltransferase involved in cell wall biosynthesis
MVWSTASLRGLAQALERFRPDVVHCHNIYHQLSPSILAATRRAGVPCVMTLHDYKLACPNYQLLDHGSLCQACVGGSALNAARRRCKGDSLVGSGLLAVESTIHRALHAYRGVDVLISPSRFLADVMARAGYGPDVVRVINHFVEHADVPQSTGAGRSVLFAGRLAPEKGVDTLVRAVGSAPALRLGIAGDGPLRAELEALATSVAPGQVTFHGRLAKPELQRLIAGSLAMVVPSRWHENQPMTILEAYAAGVPVIATALGGMPELVRDGQDGLIVPHDDPPALAAAIQTLLDDPDAASARGRSGQARLRGDFDPQTHLDRLDEAYDAATVRRRGLAPTGGVR